MIDTGARVLVTRALEDARSICHVLAMAGFTPVTAPLLQRVWDVDAMAAAAEAHPDVDWILVTSSAAAEVLAAGAPRAWPTARIAAVGPATARRLSAVGREADLIPARYTATELLQAMPDLTGNTVLYPRADLASPALADALRSRGATVHDIIAYRNVEPNDARTRLREALPVQATTLLSGSAATRLAGLIPHEERSSLGHVVAIGPSTAAAAESVGLRVHGVASPHTLQGLLDALAELL